MLIVPFIAGVVMDVHGYVAQMLGMPTWGKWVLLAGMIAVYVFLIFLLQVWRDRVVRNYIDKKLLAIRVRPSFCIRCDYNLTGIDATRCPECGTALTPVGVRIDPLPLDEL